MTEVCSDSTNYTELYGYPNRFCYLTVFLLKKKKQKKNPTKQNRPKLNKIVFSVIKRPNCHNIRSEKFHLDYLTINTTPPSDPP
jgi:hypothetical protein